MESKTWPVLYTKTATGALNWWQIGTVGAKVIVRWGQLDGATQEDEYLAEGKNIGRSNETTPEEQAQKEAQAKFDKQIRLKYVHTLEEAQNNLNIKPMRAYTLDDKRLKKLKWPITVQPKYNGVRCMAYNLPDGSVRLMSRGGKDYTLPHIQEELRGRIPAGWCLDGELYVHRTSLQTIRHYIETPTDKTLWVKLFCYDFTEIPPTNMPWGLRHWSLDNWFRHNNDVQHAVLSHHLRANSMEEIDAHHDFWVQDGFEGVMIRTDEGTYRLGSKSTQLLKYKKFQDAEFEVVSWDVGKDGVIKYACVQEDGHTFEVRPMGSAEERAQLLAEADRSIGQKLTVRFQERSDDNIPIFPVGVAFRPDKDLD